MSNSSDFLTTKVENALADLGAIRTLAKDRQLPTFDDAEELAIAQTDASGKPHFLIPAAASAWKELKSDAAREGCQMHILSAFRGFDRQVKVVRTALAAGRSLDEIFQSIAPPGCSEHHSGRALDVGTVGCKDLSEAFEQTAAFDWLAHRAAQYGFGLSFPRNNKWGYTYEPWHWCFTCD